MYVYGANAARDMTMQLSDSSTKYVDAHSLYGARDATITNSAGGLYLTGHGQYSFYGAQVSTGTSLTAVAWGYESFYNARLNLTGTTGSATLTGNNWDSFDSCVSILKGSTNTINLNGYYGGYNGMLFFIFFGFFLFV